MLFACKVLPSLLLPPLGISVVSSLLAIIDFLDLPLAFPLPQPLLPKPRPGPVPPATAPTSQASPPQPLGSCPRPPVTRCCSLSRGRRLEGTASQHAHRNTQRLPHSGLHQGAVPLGSRASRHRLKLVIIITHLITIESPWGIIISLGLLPGSWRTCSVTLISHISAT